MKLSNYIAQYLAEKGISHVFMITGGGAMHLNDALGKHPDLQCTFSHHEQACSIAAESYARLSGKMAAVNVTTGPGGINALNGVFGAYTDSIPMIVISGQVKRETMVESTGLPLRQVGDQECDIISAASGMTKYAEVVREPEQIKFHLDKALYLAQAGRPGPVWLDVPLDVQASIIDPASLVGFELEAEPDFDATSVAEVVAQLNQAERPVILVGTGIRISGQIETFQKIADALQIPIVTAFNAHDCLEDAHPNYCGRPGTVGDRAGNFTVQNSDCLLILGCRMNIRQVGYAFESFAREAYKIMVDIDPAEIAKQHLNIDMPVVANLKDFLPAFLKLLEGGDNSIVGSLSLSKGLSNGLNALSKPDWLLWCRERVQKHPVVLPEYEHDNTPMHPYAFMKALSAALPEGQTTVTGDGTACVAAFQSFVIKKGQRLFSNSGCASMGYDLPAAIGAHIASNEPVVCLAGDGSIMMNLQELSQIGYHRYPIKIFIINNGGYVSIRQTQSNYFGEPFVGVGEDSGIGFPDFKQLAVAFNLEYIKFNDLPEAQNGLPAILENDAPMLCEVMVEQVAFAPKMASQKLPCGKMVSRPLEDLAPFLSRDALAENMIIEVLGDGR